MKTVKKDIMAKIRRNEVKMKPRWYFLSRWLGLNIVTWGLILLSSGLLAWLMWQIELLEPGEVLQYGELGQEILLEEFPYGVLLSALAAGVGGYIFLRNLGENYKETSKKMLLVTGIVLVLATTGFWILKGWYELELGLSLL